MASLTGYDAWKTADPNDDHLAECQDQDCDSLDCICDELHEEDAEHRAELQAEEEWDEVA